MNTPLDIAARRNLEDEAIRLGQERLTAEASLSENTQWCIKLAQASAGILSAATLADLLHVNSQTIYNWPAWWVSGPSWPAAGENDIADGLGSRQPARRALEIMKQSDIGPFGVVTIVLTVLIQVSALARADQTGRGPVAVAAAAVTARLAMMLACRNRVPSARPDGLGALVAGTVHPLFGGILVLAALAAAGAFGWIYPAAMAIALLVSLALTSLATHRLGGITGDVLGAVAEVAAAACLIVTALS